MLTHLPSDAWRYVRDAPGTYLWLAALLVTTLALRRMTPERAAAVLNRNSTNLTWLRRAPLRVLITSGFFVAGGSWWFCAATYSLFHAPVEHRIGSWRWLALILIAHVGATLVSQGWVAARIRGGTLPAAMRDAEDYGVSYALAGSAGLLTYVIDSPWRYPYLAVVAGYHGYGWFRSRDFTSLGHAVALLLGLGCFWLL